MSVFRVNKNKNYTCMSNYHLRDTTLSLKAIGLLSKILSLPDNWDYSFKGLIAICKENKASVRTAINELKEHGYLEIIEERKPNGFFQYVYNVYEKPRTENPTTDNPTSENQPQLNTKELNTKELNTNKYDVIVRENRKIINYCEQYLGGSLTKQALDDLIDYIEFGMDADLIIRAVDKARDTNNRRWAYVNGILKNWKKDNVKTIEQAIEQDNLFHNKNDKPMSEEERREKRRQEIAEMIKRGMENDNL